MSELTSAAEQTVLELQQTVVEGLKEASADGKLTEVEIADLGNQLLNGAIRKMSDSAFGVLQAANVDINTIVTGAGEAMIAKMKTEGKTNDTQTRNEIRLRTGNLCDLKVYEYPQGTIPSG